MKQLKSIVRIALVLIMTSQYLGAISPQAPQNFRAWGYEKHIELAWQANSESDLAGYKVYKREANTTTFLLWKTSTGNFETVAQDWLADNEKNKTWEYQLSAFNDAGEESALTAIKSTALNLTMTDDEWLDMTQRATFRYFWDAAHPVSGMARERNSNDDVVTTGGTGFGIMAILVGIERGYISRSDGLNRLVQIVSFLQIADKYHGTFPHWMNGKTGQTIPFSQYDDGADLVETSFLMQGLLAARQYFDKNEALETDFRSIITQLWEGVEYNWFRQGTANFLYWHWSPKYQWKMNFPLKGFNETQIVYILAKASPKYAIPASLYSQGWASSNYLNGQSYYGYKLEVGTSKGGPLFFSHYSYLGFDPRGRKDAYCNYFTRNQAHTKINRAYCIANPKQFPNYSADCWGLTASDTYNGYTAHEPNNDNGTITPTAALSSMPYTPTESLAALKYFYRSQGKKVWGEFGFYDAFNVSKNWYATSYLAIDQGPIIAMIENYRSGLLWNNFMKNPEIEPALSALGFVKDETFIQDAPLASFDAAIFPNPMQHGQFQLEIPLEKTSTLSFSLYDLNGRLIKIFPAHHFFDKGIFNQHFDIQELAPSVYWLKIEINGTFFYKKIMP